MGYNDMIESLKYFWYYTRTHALAMLGLIIISINLLLVILAPVLAPYPPEDANPSAQLLPPGGEHLLGTDINGMDILSRIIYAPRIDLVIAVSAAILSVFIGAPLGVISGYYRGFIGEFVARSFDVLQAFPVFILAMAFVAVTGQQLANVIIVLAFLNAPIYVRLMRSETYSVRERAFVEAAQCIGNSDLGIAFRHVLPSALPPALVQLSITIGWAILLTAGLSFVGAGVRVPTPEWGSMISVGAKFIVTGEWWPSVFPGFAMGLTVLGFALMADALEHTLDPTRR